jgi:hypothetical protein
MTETKHKSNGHKKPLVSETPATASYQPPDYIRYFLRPRDLPPFTFTTVLSMLLDPTLRLGLAMRAAPLFGCEFAYKNPGSEDWTPGVKADDPIIAAFVLRQLERIWQHLDSLVSAQIWGWSAAEVQYRLTKYGKVEIDCLLPRHSNDTRALVRDGEICGVRFMQVKHAPNGRVDLPFPKAVFHNHAPEPGASYGMSILQGAYSPWADKWLHGGALDVRRLFMHKDAYGGADLGYPSGTINIAGKGEVPTRDIAREIVEQMQSGAVTTRPSDVDQVSGKERWPLTRATVPSNPTHILQYPKDLDVEELRGMEIPDEVFMPSDAGTTGWSGKSIPMQGFYTGLDRWTLRLINDLDKQVIRPLVEMNFRAEPFYEIRHKPLGLQAMEQQGEGKSQTGGSPSPFVPWMPYGQGGGDGESNGQPARMSLDPVEAVGQGVLSAAELVKAANEVINKRTAAGVACQVGAPPFTGID